MATQGKRRAFGQHFLKDRVLCDRIADRAFELLNEHQCIRMLEVGPGAGAITDPLLERLEKNVAPALTEFLLVERDRDLAARWKAEARSKLRVECADMVRIEENLWLEPSPLGVVSNLPYSAGTAIVERLARQGRHIPFMLLMFQAEVGQRLRAEPDTRAWGSLSVWTQNLWDVEKFATVPPGAFAPPPEVMSEVVLLRRRSEPRIPGTEASPEARAQWESLVRISFAHRRKMLRSGLPKSGPWLAALAKSEIDPTRRAETLDWDDWKRFFEALLSS